MAKKVDPSLLQEGKNKTRRPLSDQAKIKMTLERFFPMLEGKQPLSLKVLSKQNDNRAVGVISRAIRETLEKKLVTITMHHERVGVPNRVVELEARLKETFQKLRSVVVVDTPEQDSDDIHRDLGYMLAKVISSWDLWINDYDAVGVGSGRGPYFTVSSLKELARKSRISADHITLISLTGIISPQAPRPQSGGLYDADQCIRDLSACFLGPVTLNEIAYPVAHEDADKIRQKTWLSELEFEAHKPKYALVGVGVLRDRHRFLLDVQEDGDSKEDSGSKILEPIRHEIRSLVELVKRYESHHCPVADICNRLFYVDLPDGQAQVTHEEKVEIEALIEHINKRLLTINWGQLGKIENVILVGGTPVKALAIRQVLKDKRFRVSVLCIDKNTAEIILNAERK